MDSDSDYKKKQDKRIKKIRKLAWKVIEDSADEKINEAARAIIANADALSNAVFENETRPW